MDNLILCQASEKRAEGDTTLVDEAVVLISGIIGSKSLGNFYDKDITKERMESATFKYLKNIVLRYCEIYKNYFKDKKVWKLIDVTEGLINEYHIKSNERRDEFRKKSIDDYRNTNKTLKKIHGEGISSIVNNISRPESVGANEKYLSYILKGRGDRDYGVGSRTTTINGKKYNIHRLEGRLKAHAAAREKMGLGSDYKVFVDFAENNKYLSGNEARRNEVFDYVINEGISREGEGYWVGRFSGEGGRSEVGKGKVLAFSRSKKMAA